MTSLPKTVEDLILGRVRQLLGIPEDSPIKGRALQRLALDTKRLSDYFTRKENERPEFYLREKGLMAAYLAYFLPSNLLKINKPLFELACHPKIDLPGERGKLSVLDLGCGPGTASLGLISYLARTEGREGPLSLTITAADNTQQCLDEAALMIQRLWKNSSFNLSGKKLSELKVKTVKMDMTHLDRGLDDERYDLIFILNALIETEVGDDPVLKRCALLEALTARHLKEKGSLVIIEPALRESSRNLLMVRDELLKRGRVTLYSPCIIRERCEALDNRKDWCHEGADWEMTHLIKEIDSRTGFNKLQLKFSYLVLRGDGLNLGDLLPRRGGEYYRVVSDLLIMKGERKVFLCGERGRVLVGRLDRDLSDSNKPFDEIRRGDILEVKGIYTKGNLLRINKESTVSDCMK